MRNWKTTLFGSLSAICVATADSLPADAVWTRFGLNIASAVFLAAFGYCAADTQKHTEKKEGDTP